MIVCVVTVHALELDGYAVDPQLLISDLDLAEAHVRPLYFAGHGHQQGIQMRRFRRPAQTVLHGEAGTALNQRRFGELPFPLIQRGDGFASGGHIRLHVQHAVPVMVFQIHPADHVPDMIFANAQQIHVPENAAHAPAVLILQIGAVGPLQYLHGQGVVAVLQIISDVKLRRQTAALGHADFPAIDPYEEAGVHAVKIQRHPAAPPAFRQAENPAIYARGIFVRHIGRVKGNGVADIHILGPPVAVHLPAGGHVQLVPQHVFFFPALTDSLGQHAVGGIVKLPDAVQTQIPVRQAPFPPQGGGFIGKRKRRGSSGKTVLMQYRHVLPQAGSLHERDSSLMLHVLFRVFRPAGGKNRLYPKNTLLFQTRQYPSVSETVQSSIPCTFVPPMRLFRFAFLHLPIKKQEPPSAAPVSFFM